MPPRDGWPFACKHTSPTCRRHEGRGVWLALTDIRLRGRRAGYSGRATGASTVALCFSGDPNRYPHYPKVTAVNELMRFETASGSVVVEVAEGEPGFERVARDGIVADAGRKLEAALQDVRDAAESALAVFRDGRLQPDGIELEFGVKLNAEAGAILAKSAVEGHFAVKLCWQRQPVDRSDGDRREADHAEDALADER